MSLSPTDLGALRLVEGAALRRQLRRVRQWQREEGGVAQGRQPIGDEVLELRLDEGQEGGGGQAVVEEGVVCESKMNLSRTWSIEKG